MATEQIVPIASTHTLPAHVVRTISAYGYASRHPEDADGIAYAQALQLAQGFQGMG